MLSIYFLYQNPAFGEKNDLLWLPTDVLVEKTPPELSIRAYFSQLQQVVISENGGWYDIIEIDIPTPVSNNEAERRKIICQVAQVTYIWPYNKFLKAKTRYYVKFCKIKGGEEVLLFREN